MTAFFVTGVQYTDGAVVAARISTALPTGEVEAPDHMLSPGSVLALPELAALVESVEVRLVFWTGPDDWCPIDRVVMRDGILMSIDEEGLQTDAFKNVPWTLSKDLPSS